MPKKLVYLVFTFVKIINKDWEKKYNKEINHYKYEVSSGVGGANRIGFGTVLFIIYHERYYRSINRES